MKKYSKGGFIEPEEKEMISFMPLQIKENLRTCIVELPGKNKRMALFHKWIDKSEIISPSPMVGGHSGGELKFTMAIVEFEDGTVRCVLPERIQFTDNEFRKYCFEKGAERCERIQAEQKIRRSRN
ncbi:hypothetical protein [Anaerocolumna xylanovorans]|uniref:Uncharacterized protein n=1 Tax=Anaerocolumna xylanovorans DSM 12503 TaxID=1121345 RepID=A0A1M7YBU3_9FIRM|nr:hypothetical protein [Anaerocolumna xylanovorans]SHO50107.1 hypothetical protein SAMN02745217_02590 [Anaerocolumna xylanovorans DSM 12503]